MTELTLRERQVLDLGSRGFGPTESSEILGLRVPTVNGYRLRVKDKLGARHWFHAVALAWQQGLVGTDCLIVL